MTRYLCDTCQDGTPCCSWTISSWNGYKCENVATAYVTMPKGLHDSDGPYCHEHALEVVGGLTNGRNLTNIVVEHTKSIPVGLKSA